MRVGRVLQPVGGVDHGLDLALGDEGPDALLDGARHARLGLRGLGPQRRAGEREAAHHQAHQVELDLGAFEEGDLHDMAFERRGAQVPLDIVAAYHVEDNIGAMAARHFADGFDEILLPVIDGTDGAERLAGFRLGVIADRDDDLRPERGGELDGGRADAARPAMDEEPFAGLEPSALEHVVPDREDRLGQGGGLHGGQSVRDEQRGGFGRHRELGIAAAIGEGADEIAVLEARHVLADGDDGACDFEAEKIRGVLGRRVEALALEHVGAIDARRLNDDEHFVRCGLRHGPLRRH